MSSDDEEFIKNELVATRLELSIYAVDDHAGKPWDVDELNQVVELVEDKGFRVAENSYNVTILTEAFVTTDENISKLIEIKETLEEWYPDYEVATTPIYGDEQHADGEAFERIQMMWVE